MPGRMGFVTTGWESLRRRESAEPYWTELQQFVDAERARGTVYPPPDEVFAALDLTPYGEVKAVILGQDPYHGPGQAHGLSFSVREGIRPPPSLRNIFSELQADRYRSPNHGCLEHWARQGVLLLNASLTVRAGQAKSHVGKGWEPFTDAVLRMIDAKDEPVVFMLWGKVAQKKKVLFSGRHHVIESAHPSPYSARKGFFGSRPFSKANEALKEAGREPIDWGIPDR